MKQFVFNNGWLILMLLGLATHELIDSFIRPVHLQNDGIQSFILGVIPNFLAAALIFPFAGLVAQKYYSSAPKDTANQNTWFFVSLALSQLGLIAWEFLQLTGNLVFDWYDILATLLGGITAVALYTAFKKVPSK